MPMVPLLVSTWFCPPLNVVVLVLGRYVAWLPIVNEPWMLTFCAAAMPPSWG